VLKDIDNKYNLYIDCALLDDGSTRQATITVDNGKVVNIIAGMEVEPRHVVALPGIIDLHGDAIEHPLMPRPGVNMPVDVALFDTDRRLAANGISTALHGLTCSWEPGLRSAATINAVFDGFDRLGGSLWVDHRVHLRFESHALNAVADARRWMESGRVDLLAVNRHFPMTLAAIDDVAHLAPLAKRAGLTIAAYQDLMRDLASREAEVEQVVAEIFAIAGKAGIARASHDDRTAEERAFNRAQGAAIVDFPTALPAAQAAHEAGEHVIMGSPNVVRGGSHMSKGISAADMVKLGYCTILASDYFYPALPAAAIKLWREYGLGFAEAWNLVSANPADAVGLKDRGTLSIGKRADIVLLDLGADGDETPRVVELHVAGRRVLSEASRNEAGQSLTA